MTWQVCVCAHVLSCACFRACHNSVQATGSGDLLWLLIKCYGAQRKEPAISAGGMPEGFLEVAPWNPAYDMRY